MTFAKLVGFSLEVDGMASSTKKEGFKKEEGSRSKFKKNPGKGRKSGNSTSHGSFMEFDFGDGNGVGFSSLDQGVDFRDEEEVSVVRNFDLNNSGICSTGIKEEVLDGVINDNTQAPQKKKSSKKSKLAVRDPDWFPEQGSCIQPPGGKERGKSAKKRSKPTRSQDRKVPTHPPKPIVENVSVPDDLKNVLSSSGWIVVYQEGACHAIFVSSSGSVYGSLPQSLEAYFREMPKFREKECGSSPSVGSSRRGVAKKTCKRKGVASKIGNDKESQDVHKMVTFCCEGNQETSGIGDGCLNSERKQMNKGSKVTAVSSDNCDVDVQKCKKFKLGAHLKSHEGNKNKNSKEGSPVPEKMRYREVHELMTSSVLEEKKNGCVSNGTSTQGMPPTKQELEKNVLRDIDHVLPSCMTDEKEKSSAKDVFDKTIRMDWSNAIVKYEQNIDSIDDTDDLDGVRRSTRINGRHVPVDSEVDLEMWVNDDFINLLAIVDEAVEPSKVTTMSTEVENCKREASEMCDSLFKRTSTMKCDYQKSKNKKALVTSENSNTSERFDGIKVSKKNSTSWKKSVAKGLIKEQCSLSASKRKLLNGEYSDGKKKKKRNGGCGLIVRRTDKSDHEKTRLSKYKVSMLSWLIDSGTLSESERVIYKIENGSKNVLKGWVTRGGIRCNCCKKIFSLLEFEAHGGSNLRQPWNITCLISGKSLQQCQSEAWEKEKKQRKIGFQPVGIGDADPSDDTCGICADGGDLICCDGCPSTFHQECVMLKSLPEGNWYCPFCRCTFCSLVDHGQEISKGSLLGCNQCGCKYHRDCISGHDMDKSGLDSLYCGNSCKKVAAGLSDMLGVCNPLGGGFSWSLIRRLNEEDMNTDQRRASIMECNAKLPLALLVLHECFIPLLDPRSGLDMIAQAVYNCGSNFNRLNYEGFYTAILEKGDAIISVATLRFHGTRLVEMPFIGTRPIYRRQGMCRRLLNAIDEMLFSLHVEKLMIPAIPEMLETWMNSFSFRQLELSHKDEIRSLNMIIFAETTLLQKSLCYKRENDSKDEKQHNVAGTLGQGTDKSHDLLNSDGGQIEVILNCCSSDYSKQGYEVVTPCEVIEAPVSADNELGSLHSDVSDGSVFEVCPVHKPLVQNMDMLSQTLETSSIPLTSVDIILDEASVQSKLVSLPDRHVLMSAES